MAKTVSDDVMLPVHVALNAAVVNVQELFARKSGRLVSRQTIEVVSGGGGSHTVEEATQRLMPLPRVWHDDEPVYLSRHGKLYVLGQVCSNDHDATPFDPAEDKFLQPVPLGTLVQLSTKKKRNLRRRELTAAFNAIAQMS